MVPSDASARRPYSAALSRVADFAGGLDRRFDVDHSYVYCQSGRRSGIAAERPRGLGYAEACKAGSYRALAAVGFDTALPDSTASDG